MDSGWWIVRRLWKPKAQLWLPWMPPPVMRFAGGYPCCGCRSCAGRRPSQWQVNISGVANRDPEECGGDCTWLNANSPFVVDFDSTDPTDLGGSDQRCYWKKVLGTTLCTPEDPPGFSWLVLRTSHIIVGDWYHINVSITPGTLWGVGSFFSAGKWYAARPTCEDLSGESLPDLISSAWCDVSGASCSVTAL